MNENPYQPPQDLSEPTWQAKDGIASNRRLRGFGVLGGFVCSAAFFGLMGYVWTKSGQSHLDEPAFLYAVSAGVGAIFLVGIASLVAIVAGNAAGSDEQRSDRTSLPYGGWTVFVIALTVIILLGWLASRDPLAVRPG